MNFEVAHRNVCALGVPPLFQAGDSFAPAWGGKGFALPLRTVAELDGGEAAAYLEIAGVKVPAVVRRGDAWEFAFDPFLLMDDLLHERWHEPLRPPATSLLPFHYHAVPGPVRMILARHFSRSHRTPPWTPPAESLEYLRAFLIRLGLLKGGSWPEGKRWVFCATHDVDTAAGFGLIREFHKVERTRGVRSQWNIVADHYPIDWGLLRDLEAGGHEIASHGWNHDNRIAFLPEAGMRDRLRRIRERFEGRVNLRGFRSPSLLVSQRLFDLLPEFFAYDSSVCDRQIDNDHGCRSLFPFARVVRGGTIPELPITLDMDSSLLFRGDSARAILRRWLEKLEWIKAVGGVAVSVTHTEPHFSGNRPMLEIYARILDHVRHDDSVWITVPSEVSPRLS